MQRPGGWKIRADCTGSIVSAVPSGSLKMVNTGRYQILIGKRLQDRVLASEILESEASPVEEETQLLEEHIVRLQHDIIDVVILSRYRNF